MHKLINFKNLTCEKLEQIYLKYCEFAIGSNNQIANLDKNNLNYFKCFELFQKEEAEFEFDTVLLDLEQLHPDEKIRNISAELNKKINAFNIEQSMRKDVFEVISHYYNVQYKVEEKNLDVEQRKYVKKTMIGYEMMGLNLPDEISNQVKTINKQLSLNSSDYSMNLSNVKTEIYFVFNQLNGMDNEWLLNRRDIERNQYKIKLQYPDYVPIMEYCKVRETRKIMSELMGARCTDTNLDIMLSSINLRQHKANLFGFSSHSDYKLQNSMAKNSSNVMDFLTNLLKLIKPLVTNDLDKLIELAMDLDKINKLESYDIAYYTRIYIEKETKLNMKDLQKLFTIESVTTGIFSIYQELLGFKFVDITEQSVDSLYCSNIKLFCVYDVTNFANSNNPLGYFYLDLFPREGKYGHAAMFTLMRKSKYNLPVSAIVCNFDPKLNVDFDNVVTYFHEFGHLMHNMSSTNNIASLSGTSCQRDFVETPSQMFEEWCYCLEPLKRLVTPEYYNEVTVDLVTKINKQNKLMQGIFNAKQLSYGLLDMAIHSANIPNDTWKFYNDLTVELFGWNISPQVNMLTNWGHMFGYDSSYYGYLWSKVYSIDLFSYFKGNELDQNLGLKLRAEILSKGGSLDGDELLRNFMKREPNPNAYIEWLLN